MAKTRREIQREQTTVEIKEVARQQMAETGAAALSLRAIAREMGMSTPALYRYFENRDALVTALIIDAYTALGDAMLAAMESVDETDFYGRFHAVTKAFRDWALAYPADFTLIYGTPIPGYHAPGELTIPVAGRILEIFGLIFARAYQHSKLEAPHFYTELPADMAQIIKEFHRLVEAEQPGVPEVAITLTLYILPRVYGLVWAEQYNHFPPGFADSGYFYTLEIDAMFEQLGLIR